MSTCMEPPRRLEDQPTSSVEGAVLEEQSGAEPTKQMAVRDQLTAVEHMQRRSPG